MHRHCGLPRNNQHDPQAPLPRQGRAVRPSRRPGARLYGRPVGRNQEPALAAAPGLDGLGNTAVFSVGSDGTDGPTDAAGGYVDGSTAARLRAAGIDPDAALADNDSYRALSSVGGLLLTGPTGTNVNDVSVVLIG